MGDVKLVILDGDRMIYIIYDMIVRLIQVNIIEHIDRWIYIYKRPIYQQCALAYHPLMEFLLDDFRRTK